MVVLVSPTAIIRRYGLVIFKAVTSRPTLSTIDKNNNSGDNGGGNDGGDNKDNEFLGIMFGVGSVRDDKG